MLHHKQQIQMKAKRGWMMLAAVLTISVTSVLTSCSDDSSEPHYQKHPKFQSILHC